MKSLGYILLSIFFFLTVGVSALFFLGLHHQRAMIRQKVYKVRNIRVFSYSEEEYNAIEWTRRNKEFKSNGVMYDVVRTEKLQGTIKLYCVADAEETVLRNKLDDYFSHSTDNNAIFKHIQKVLDLKYFVFSSDKIYMSGISFEISSFYMLFYPQNYLSVVVPPPKQAA